MERYDINRWILIPLLLIVLIGACGETVDPEPPPPSELPKINIGSVTLFEGNENKNFNFPISLNKTAEKEVSVSYTTSEVTAGDGTDFVGRSGTFTIPVGERNGLLEIEIIADSLKEQDEEFRVILSNPVNATIQVSQATGTIRNDDTFVDVPEDGYITPDDYPGFNLVWRDEFNGSQIDASNWTHEIGGHGWGNNESQYYTDRSENSYVVDGNLVIEAKEEAFNGSDYTSARMITSDKQEFAFGRVDIRAILPEGQGIWPALWMLGENFWDIGWPACGEIDIMELVGHEPSKVHGTAHWGPQGQGFSNFVGSDYSINGEKFSEKYHVFSIIWEQDEIKWYVDDNEFHTLTPDDVNGAYPFNAEFFFIFNIAVGGNWPGYPDASTQFPQQMYVDYIRVFQKE